MIMTTIWFYRGENKDRPSLNKCTCPCLYTVTV